MEGEFIVITPQFVVFFSHQLQKLLIAAFFAKTDVIALRDRIKIQKFVVYFVFLIVCLPGNQSCYGSRNAVCLQIFHDADAFVAFLYIKLVHKFVGNNWVSDTVVDLMVIDQCPFHAKFRVFRKQGHEIIGESVGASFRFGSDDFGERNINQSQIFNRSDFRIG